MRIAAGREPFELGGVGVMTVMMGRIDVYDPGILHRRSLRTTTHTFTRVTKRSMVHVRHARTDASINSVPDHVRLPALNIANIGNISILHHFVQNTSKPAKWHFAHGDLALWWVHDRKRKCSPQLGRVSA
ncbi:MAG TPA: hypothetical protein PLL77_08830 [Pyrinomonadaceae bacterium]|nr:hypothetical protein [Pyrinomonadaceae bacterium]